MVLLDLDRRIGSEQHNKRPTSHGRPKEVVGEKRSASGGPHNLDHAKIPKVGQVQTGFNVDMSYLPKRAVFRSIDDNESFIQSEYVRTRR